MSRTYYFFESSLAHWKKPTRHKQFAVRIANYDDKPYSAIGFDGYYPRRRQSGMTGNSGIQRGKVALSEEKWHCSGRSGIDTATEHSGSRIICIAAMDRPLLAEKVYVRCWALIPEK